MTSNPERRIVRITVIDGHEIVRHGLEHLLGTSEGLSVVGSVSTLKEAYASLPSQRPDVVVADMFLPDGQAIELLSWLKDNLPGCALVCLNPQPDSPLVHEAISSGIHGLIPKTASTETIIDTVRRTSRGECYVDSDILLSAFNHTQPGSSPLNVLSQQESRVLTFMADGMTNREIASRMSLSEKTVKNYSSHMMGKLGVTRRTEAAALFWKHNKTQQA